MDSNDNKIKWGIIGPGNIAHTFVHDLAFIKEYTNVITGVVSIDPKESEAFCEEFSVPYNCATLHDLLKMGELDCIYIATPHPFHFAQALECLQYNLPVLCEKPLAMNESQVQTLINMAREHGTFLMEGMWLRFLPSMRQVLELIEKNVIGKIKRIEASMTYKAPKDNSSRYFNPALGGGSLLDLGIYPVYLSYLLLGVPKHIKASADIGETGIDETCSVLLSYEDGAVTALQSSLIKRDPLIAVIHGEKGRIEIGEHWNEMPEYIYVFFHDGSSQHYYPKWDGYGLQFEILEAIQCMKDARVESPLLTHQDSLSLIKILDEIRKQTNIKYPRYE
jgi:predicted dehydrogenase